MKEKKTGLQLQDVRQTSEELQRIAKTAFETQEGIMVTDANKVILRVNQAFTRLTGYSSEEAVGQTPTILSSGRHDKGFYQAMWESIIRDHYWQGEIWNRRRNGEIFPVWLTITAVFDDHERATPVNLGDFLIEACQIPSLLDDEGRATYYVGTFSDFTQQEQAKEALLDTRNRLEKQVSQTTAELQLLKDEFEEVNMALKVLLRHRETDKSEAQSELEREMVQVVLPFLQKLKKSSLAPKQVDLLGIIEANLQHLVSSYGRTTTFFSASQQLTPKEMQVASMVRNGLSTKAIAATLSLSPETINIHRKRIRRKLGLDSKASNLRSYLMSLTD